MSEESLPFAFGITIAKLSAQSTNESWVSFLGSLYVSGKLPIYPREEHFSFYIAYCNVNDKD